MDVPHEACEKLRFCETRPVFLLTLPRLSLSVKSVGVAFCVPNGFFMSQMGLSTILKREGCNRGDTLPFSDTLVAPLPNRVGMHARYLYCTVPRTRTVLVRQQE